MADAALPVAEPALPVAPVMLADGTPAPAPVAAPAAAPAHRGPREIDPATAAAIQDGVELVRGLLADPPQAPRWPMYLPPDQAVHPCQPSRLRRPEVRIDRGPDAGLPEGRAHQARTRSSGRPARVRRRRLRRARRASAQASQPDPDAQPAAPPSSANVYRPKSVTLGWVIGDDGEDAGEGDESGESQEAGDESPAMQIARSCPMRSSPRTTSRSSSRPAARRSRSAPGRWPAV